VPALRDATAAFPLAGSTSSKAERVSEAPSQAGCRRQGAAFNSTSVQGLDKTHTDKSLPFGWQQWQLASAGTNVLLSRLTSPHVFVGPCVCPACLHRSQAPLPVSWVPYLLASKHALTRLSLVHSESPLGCPSTGRACLPRGLDLRSATRLLLPLLTAQARAAHTLLRLQ